MSAQAAGPTCLGLIAGYGRFPFLVLEGAQRAGCHVVVIGLRDLADPQLAERAAAFHWTGLARLGRWIRILKRAGAQRVILAGAVRKQDMYARFRWWKHLPDLTSLRLWFFRLKDKRNDAVLSAVADEFARHGIIMDSCVRYTQEHLAPAGVLTRQQPTPAQWADVHFGWPIAKQMGELDIGQSIAVKETEVIAVEAIEGTDRMIERTGRLCPRGGWILIKVAKPKQDLRFDVPTVGPDTIAILQQHGAAMLVVEAGKTVLIDREEIIRAADHAGIVVLAYTESEPAGGQPSGSA
ncbi:MAG TPA: UDP-2,3-diacylglucosamine diphosphatase LpxI [Phycisphaerae bacterium]|nr:UDP-2,3-diacylglucosamine diphosphatase LpxI [Phycisphaerae bacterium]HNU46971.1 UDP-2,3-diacylglucosamine diphosphatase LpxI [Phycisphaerae bacterium]